MLVFSRGSGQARLWVSVLGEGVCFLETLEELSEYLRQQEELSQVLSACWPPKSMCFLHMLPPKGGIQSGALKNSRLILGSD